MEPEFEGSSLREAPFSLINEGREEYSQKSHFWFLVNLIISAIILVVAILVALTVLGTSLPLSIVFRNSSHTIAQPSASIFECESGCEYTLVETIPDQLVVIPAFKDTTETWLEIINNAKESVRLVVFYWDMTNNVTIYGDNGNRVMEAIKKRASEIKIQVVQNMHSEQFTDEPDMSLLRSWGVEIVEIDWAKAFGGVLHSKMIIGDDKEFYLGSANMDWKSLNQVKELGIHVKCECLTKDVNLIFDKFHYLGADMKSDFSKFEGWPQRLMTALSMKTPMKTTFNDKPGTAYITAAPKLFASPGRTNDLDALRNTILSAKEYVYISVMDYTPFDYYGVNHHWWGEIDDAIREAFIRGANVKMLISKWDSTAKIQINALSSLANFGKDFCQHTEYKGKFWCNSTLEIKQYIVPDPTGYEKQPFTRVNHAKYMVTENTAFISTSNWSKDYFYSTAGSTLVSSHENVRNDLKTVFLRDWESEYAHPLPSV